MEKIFECFIILLFLISCIGVMQGFWMIAWGDLMGRMAIKTGIGLIIIFGTLTIIFSTLLSKY
jgi:hypothetical protein